AAVAGGTALAAGCAGLGRIEFVCIAAGMRGTAALRSDFALLVCVHCCKAATGRVLVIAWIVRHIRSPEMMVLGKASLAARPEIHPADGTIMVEKSRAPNYRRMASKHVRNAGAGYWRVDLFLFLRFAFAARFH